MLWSLPFELPDNTSSLSSCPLAQHPVSQRLPSTAAGTPRREPDTRQYPTTSVHIRAEVGKMTWSTGENQEGIKAAQHNGTTPVAPATWARGLLSPGVWGQPGNIVRHHLERQRERELVAVWLLSYTEHFSFYLGVPNQQGTRSWQSDPVSQSDFPSDCCFSSWPSMVSWWTQTHWWRFIVGKR
jgi:hypothetical protein